MSRLGILMGAIVLGVVSLFGLPLILALAFIPVSNAIIDNKGWAAIIAIFGGAILGVGLPRLYVKWLDRSANK